MSGPFFPRDGVGATVAVYGCPAPDPWSPPSDVAAPPFLRPYVATEPPAAPGSHAEQVELHRSALARREEELRKIIADATNELADVRAAIAKFVGGSR